MGLVYGMGRGAVRKRGTTVPELIGAVVGRGRGFVVGEGRNVMSCKSFLSFLLDMLPIHLHLLSSVRLDTNN